MATIVVPMRIKKTSDPSSEPWGTPDMTALGSDLKLVKFWFPHNKVKAFPWIFFKLHICVWGVLVQT